MSNLDNIKSFFNALSFISESGSSSIWSKTYVDDYKIKIKLDEADFAKSTINWGYKITIGSGTTSNFSQEETLVVLECVDRLLIKGYKPEDLYLEKVYPSGHGTSGRLDILVQKEGEAFLMIECKTWGKEFEKELKNTDKDGGQLLKYLQQDKSAQYLVLYASRFENKSVEYKNEIIVVEQSYRETSNVKDLFERWNKFTKTTGIFETWVKPYNFESKALTTRQLKPITQGDSSFIFNRFLEILRHNAVSDKPNAFNRIFTLFLCKVKDEDRNDDDELDFQWKEGEDDHISFQIRLSDLYKSAMKEFLEKEITDLSDEQFENKFGKLEESVKEDLKAEFIKLRLQKNNEFAIKDVFDQETFEENAIVLKEVVELLQPFKFRYNKKQPFLGEFFELLLTTGLKQEVGQFFTPVPIARFICRSIPMKESVVKKLHNGETNELLPNIIDYACGSGHFLTESMEEIHNIIVGLDSSQFTPKTAKNIESWKINQFDWAIEHIYGIERDYRLVKTTKVGCYLHGDGIARIIHGDGLDAFDSKNYQGKLKLNEHKPENPKFDFILSNPPYSVSAFKGNLKNKYATVAGLSNDKKPFELYDSLTDQSSEIEVLFIERTKQLLKDGGITAIILPSSILSNTGLYTKTREILIKYFEFVSIVELGSNTFMATGTNTVILFLKRRNNYYWQTVQSHIQKAFELKQDLTINGVEKLISKFLEIENTEQNLNEYLEKYQSDEFEKEKILYFALAYPQKIVLAKTGEKDEEKKFLGYYFSNRRGHEGIKPFVAGQSIDECTYLFDENNLYNPKVASSYIQKAFAGELENIQIDEEIAKNVSVVNFADLIDFEAKKFEKIINTRSKKKLKIESKWEVVKLGEVVKVFNGFAFKSEDYVDNGIRLIRIKNVQKDLILDDNPKFLPANYENKYPDFVLKQDDILISMTGNPGRIGKIKSDLLPALLNQRVGKLEIISGKVLKEYIYQSLNTDFFENYCIETASGIAQLNISSTQIESYLLPLPPLNIQTQIVAEIEKIEKERQKAKVEIEKLQNQISELVANAGGEEVRLGDILSLEYGSGLISQDRIVGKYPVLGSNGIVGYHNEFLIEGPSIIVGRKGSAGKITWVEENNYPIDTTFWVKLNNGDLKFIYFKLLQLNLEKLALGSGVPGLSRNNVYDLKTNLPSLPTQQKIVAQIQEIEKKIEVLQSVLDSVKTQKEDALKKFL